MISMETIALVLNSLTKIYREIQKYIIIISISEFIKFVNSPAVFLQLQVQYKTELRQIVAESVNFLI